MSALIDYPAHLKGQVFASIKTNVVKKIDSTSIKKIPRTHEMFSLNWYGYTAPFPRWHMLAENICCQGIFKVIKHLKGVGECVN